MKRKTTNKNLILLTNELSEIFIQSEFDNSLCVKFSKMFLSKNPLFPKSFFKDEKYIQSFLGHEFEKKIIHWKNSQ